MWNERYSEPGYLFGTEPAAFLRREASRLSAGQTALCVADGEGRNSVYLAGLRLSVTAMDASEVAVEKAQALARANSVTVDFHVADIARWDWTARPYDVVAGIFFQFAGPSLRDEIFAGMIRALAAGGLLMLQGYTPAQLVHNTGGPRVLENLYTSELLRDRFRDLDLLHLDEYEADLAEGSRHLGRSALIDLVARRRH